MTFIIDLFLHLDKHLADIIAQYGIWTYALLFSIIFMETGFVVTPFLPGDSLIFAAGTFAALGSLNIWWLFVLLAVAAVAGDMVNYWIGHYVGDRAYTSKWINKEHLERTHAFFEKRGGKTIFLARFVPIVRTFAPFVAGIGRMSFGYFFFYNVFGGIIWVASFLLSGYALARVPWIHEHFSVVTLAIILISLIPILVEIWQVRRESLEKV